MNKYEEPSAEIIKQPIPEYDMSIQHTHFRKNHVGAIKHFGSKSIKDETAHWDEIGKNPSKCRELYGLGSVLNDLNMGFNFNSLDNHVWLQQVNLADPDKKRMFVCFNCGSLKMWDGRFIPYTDLK